jgi:hypothetical protein
MSFIGLHTPASPSRKPNPHRSESLTDSHRRRRQKDEEDPHLHKEEITRVKFERLRSIRLIRRDPKATKLDMQGFK